MINPLKKKLFETKGTTESKELDKILETILEIKENKDNICISEISILELICTLNRQKSGNKIFKILSLLYDTCNILPFNYNIIRFAWFIGSDYSLHSGDSLHISFCLFNKMDIIIIKEGAFFNSFKLIKEDFLLNGVDLLNNYYSNLPTKGKLPESIVNAYSNLKEVQIKQISED